MLVTAEPTSQALNMSFYTYRLGKFLKTKTDVELSAQPEFEDQTLDFSDVEQLMESINTVPGVDLVWASPQEL